MKNTNLIYEKVPIVFDNIEVKGYSYIDLSVDDKVVQLALFYERQNIYNIPAQKMSGKTSKASFIEWCIEDIFEEMKCTICGETTSAIRITNTEIGKVCNFCWACFDPPLPWKQLDGLNKLIKDNNIL